MRGVWNNTEKSLTFVIRGAGLFHLHIVVWGQFCNALLNLAFSYIKWRLLYDCEDEFKNMETL